MKRMIEEIESGEKDMSREVLYLENEKGERWNVTRRGDAEVTDYFLWNLLFDSDSRNGMLWAVAVLCVIAALLKATVL